MSEFADLKGKHFKLNQDLHGFSKGTIIEFERLKYHHKVLFANRVKDSEIDNCLSLVLEAGIEAPKKTKK